MTGYVVVRDENGCMVCDWDGEIHPTLTTADLEMRAAELEWPQYEWYLAEVRRAEEGRS